MLVIVCKAKDLLKKIEAITTLDGRASKQELM